MQCCGSDPDPYVLDLPDPDPLVRRTDPEPSIIKQNQVCLQKDVKIPSKSNKQKNP